MYDVAEPDAHTLAASYNIAPTQETYIIDQIEEQRRLRIVRWGLVPAWSRDASGAARLINARAETVAEKPSFRAAFARRRCIVPMDGWYEWSGTSKQPWFVSSVDGLSSVAGIVEWWRPPNADPNDAMAVLNTMSVITTAANEDVSHFHDRMPVLIDQADLDLWLDPASAVSEIQHLLRSADPGRVQAWKVSRAVSQVRNNDPALILPATPDEPPAGSEQQSLW